MGERRKEAKKDFFSIQIMKPLLPTLREKKRYIAYEVVSETALSFQEIKNAISETITTFLGVLGAAHAGVIMTNKYNTKKNRGLLRVSHTYVDHVKAALLFIMKIGTKNVTVRSVGVSGIIKKAEANYLR